MAQAIVGANCTLETARRQVVIEKIRDFLCYTDPDNIAFGSIVFLLLLGIMIFMPWVVIGIVFVSILGTVAIILSGLGIANLVKKLQEKCHEIPKDEED